MAKENYQHTIQLDKGFVDSLKSDILETINLALLDYQPSKKETSDEKLISEDELSERLGVSKVTLKAWRDKGILPYSRLQKRIYYNWPDVLKAMHKYNKLE